MAGKSFYSNEIKEFWPFQKVAQKVAIFLGYFFEKKFRLQPKKVAQMAKFRPIWSHWMLVCYCLHFINEESMGQAK